MLTPERLVEFIAAARTDIPALLAEVRRLSAQIERVRGFHVPVTHDRKNGWWGDPFTSCYACRVDFPCPTIRALTEETHD